jgi:phosphopantothenoylcysteine decarboxylase/phosphopantothenate--cysteine ligase
MRVLITAGPTYEPIDPVRFIGNRSSGKMGAAIVNAAVATHDVSAILGQVAVPIHGNIHRIDIQTADEMLQAVTREFPNHDLLIMAAAVADYRPKKSSSGKISRQGDLTLELESTPDILAAAGKMKRKDQRTVGFSLESSPDLSRVRRKMLDKNLDLIVYNPLPTLGSDRVDATLLWPNGREEKLPSLSKADFADILLRRSMELFGK